MSYYNDNDDNIRWVSPYHFTVNMLLDRCEYYNANPSGTVD